MEAVNISQAFEYYKTEKILLNGLSIKTAKNYNGACRSFIEFHSDISVLVINDVIIMQWKYHMMNAGLASSTVSKYVACMKKILGFCQGKGMEVMDVKLIDVPKAKYKPPTYVYSEEVKKMILAADNIRDKALISMLFSTGCRISELLNINRDDLNGDEVIVTGKFDKVRTVFIDAPTMKLLNAYLLSRKDKLRPLFVSGQNRRLHCSTVEKFLHTYADLAGIDKNVTPHTFRHGMATNLLLNGADLRSAQLMLGHANIQTTTIYTHFTQPELKKIHQKFHKT